MNAEQIMIKHGRAMYKQGLEYGLVMARLARATDKDVVTILEQKLKRENGSIEVEYEEGYGVEEMVVVKRDGVTKIEWIPF